MQELRQYSHNTLTILDNAVVSDSLVIEGYAWGGIIIPAATDAATLSFQVQAEPDGTWANVCYNGAGGTTAGAEVSLALASVGGKRIALPDEVFRWYAMRLEINADNGADMVFTVTLNN